MCSCFTLSPRAVGSPLMALNWRSDLILFTLIKDLTLDERIGWDKSGSWEIRKTIAPVQGDILVTCSNNNLLTPLTPPSKTCLEFL